MLSLVVYSLNFYLTANGGTIYQEKPFVARLKDGIWTVEGSLPKQYIKGGVAIVEISKDDGRILRASHGE